MYQFEWFNPALGTPVVTIAEYGLGFNKAAIDAIKNPKKVKLGFDKDSRIIAVAPSSEDDPAALPFAEKERNGYIRINSKDFVRFVLRYLPEIKLEKAVRCLAWYDDKSGALLADIKNIIESEAEVISEEQ